MSYPGGGYPPGGYPPAAPGYPPAGSDVSIFKLFY